MPDTAASQLRRILHLIPMCEEDVPHPIEESSLLCHAHPQSYTVIMDVLSGSPRDGQWGCDGKFSHCPFRTLAHVESTVAIFSVMNVRRLGTDS